MTSILVVDDDERFRKTMRLTLESSGFDVCEVSSGEEGLAAARACVPDLILLDWEMPEIDGIEMCRTLRTWSKVPVIMFSGNRSNRKEAAFSAGANGWISKPFSIDDLLRQIESVLKYQVRRARPAGDR